MNAFGAIGSERRLAQSVTSHLQRHEYGLKKLLNEGTNPTDLDWVMVQQQANDQSLKSGKAIFPILQFGFQCAKVAYCFSSGEIFVQIEDLVLPKYFVQLTERDWNEFLKVEKLVVPLLKILEDRSILTVEYYLKQHRGKVSKDPGGLRKFVIRCSERLMIFVVHSLLDGCWEVQLRFVQPPGEEEIFLGVPHKLSSNYMSFLSGTFDFFSGYLVKELSHAVQGWKQVNKTTGTIWRDLTRANHSFERRPFCPRLNY